MAIVTMNISLNEDLKSFVDERVKKRGYSSCSEYVRDLVRKDEAEAAKERLRALIQEGLDSGRVCLWTKVSLCVRKPCSEKPLSNPHEVLPPPSASRTGR